MRNKLHDGPTHLPIGPRNNEPLPPKKRVKASLAALQWAAERAGLSYGVFTQNLTAKKELEIQRDFEAHLAQRQAELEKRKTRWIVEDVPTTEGYIINDDDP